jgi:hypothetical protein
MLVAYTLADSSNLERHKDSLSIQCIIYAKFKKKTLKFIQSIYQYISVDLHKIKYLSHFYRGENYILITELVVIFQYR